jgi:putative ABC transport system substrate-binding protein
MSRNLQDGTVLVIAAGLWGREMRRREFINLLGGVTATWPLVALAQHPVRRRRIGVLMGFPETDEQAKVYFSTFRESLQKLGWAEDNIRIDIRWARHADVESMRSFAKELVALAPDLILSNTTPTTTALLKQTRTIPIVFAMIADPVGSGFVESFARPGGNATGFVVTDGSLGGKWVQFLKEIAPHVTRVAMLFNPAVATYSEFWLNPFKAAAASSALEATAAPVRDVFELEAAIAEQSRNSNGAFVVMPDSFTDAHPEVITSLAARHHVPAIYAYRFFVSAGGLLSYGVDLTDNFRRAATYADRILKGEDPANLPVQAPTKYVLTVNLTTAQSLGLTIPPGILSTADEVMD